jgi:large subunit ribosomal protein L18
MSIKNKRELGRLKRHSRIRKSVLGTAEKPRLIVHRSLANLYAQFIDDLNRKTLLSVSTLDQDFIFKSKYGGNVKAAGLLGEFAAQKAKEKKIEKIVFDRGGYLYHGRIKAFAEAARKGGLLF